MTAIQSPRNEKMAQQKNITVAATTKEKLVLAATKRNLAITMQDYRIFSKIAQAKPYLPSSYQEDILPYSPWL